MDSPSALNLTIYPANYGQICPILLSLSYVLELKKIFTNRWKKSKAHWLAATQENA